MGTEQTGTERTLEEIFDRLEEITSAMENPDTGLEASFALYKEGSELLKQADGRIDLVQKQVQVLQQGPDGAGESFEVLDESSFAAD